MEEYEYQVERIQKMLACYWQVASTSMPDTDTWDEYCEASLDLSNQEDVGKEQDEAQ